MCKNKKSEAQVQTQIANHLGCSSWTDLFWNGILPESLHGDIRKLTSLYKLGHWDDIILQPFVFGDENIKWTMKSKISQNKTTIMNQPKNEQINLELLKIAAALPDVYSVKDLVKNAKLLSEFTHGK